MLGDCLEDSRQLRPAIAGIPRIPSRHLQSNPSHQNGAPVVCLGPSMFGPWRSCCEIRSSRDLCWVAPLLLIELGHEDCFRLTLVVHPPGTSFQEVPVTWRRGWSTVYARAGWCFVGSKYLYTRQDAQLSVVPRLFWAS